MDLQPHKDSLYNFVISNFTRDDYHRAEVSEWTEIVDNFRNYNEFVRHQRAVINNADVNTITFLQQFQTLIQLGNICLVDKESMIPFDADGFIFVNGKILFTNPE